jgi:hypothetical protein
MYPPSFGVPDAPHLSTTTRPMLAVEYAAAGSSCIAYSDRFFVDEAGESVCHEMAVSFFPNWLGQRHTRKVKIAGEFLQLTVDRPIGEPKIATLTWRRSAAKLMHSVGPGVRQWT